MHTTSQYKYQKLKTYLMEKIQSGGLGNEGRVESEPQLSAQFELSRNTIRQAIRELENEGYVYRIQGKGTFIRCAEPVRSRKIALLIYDSTYMVHPVTGALIRGIDEVLTREGYMLDILASKRSFHDENLARLAESHAGFLIGAYQLDDLTWSELEKISLPMLLVKNYSPNRNVNALRIDFKRAGFLAAEHLITTGCRDLALIYSGDEIAISEEFKDGVCTAALEYGCRLRGRNIFVSDFSEHSGLAKIAAQILAGTPRPDGIICASDEQAVALLGALKQEGIAVPEDIAVIGCNNTAIATLPDVQLTTIDIPVMELGRRSAAMLLEMIQGGKPLPVLLEPSLVVRNSTRTHKS